jgi:hypothetical protein
MITVIAAYQLPEPIARGEAREILPSTAPKSPGIPVLQAPSTDAALSGEPT